ncbi:MAG: retropepsin-like aspartic protease [Chloroflexota bacterium]|nr:retropepsin-like aspartic protease [Chloroflexota bacterium]
MRQAARVVFLVDTGADRTTLMPRDINALGLDLRLDEFGRSQTTGVGGSVQTSQAPASLFFADDEIPDGLRRVNLIIDLLMPEDAQAAARLPSLLGRDFLNRCACVFDPANNRLAIDYKAVRPA